jgi:hypothetical protein
MFIETLGSKKWRGRSRTVKVGKGYMQDTRLHRPRRYSKRCTSPLRAEIRAGELLADMAKKGKRKKAGSNQHKGSDAVVTT